MKPIKTLLIILSILVSISIILGVLFYFRNPVWNSVYENASYSYIPKYLYKSSNENTFRGPLWLSYTETSAEGDYHFHILSQDGPVDIALSPALKEDTGTDLYSLFSNDAYTIYFSLTFSSQKKNFADEMLCTYFGGKYCDKEYKLVSWRIYKNAYPYPELNDQESIDMLKWEISGTIDRLTTDNLLTRDYGNAQNVALYALGQSNLQNEIRNYSLQELDNGYLFFGAIPKDDTMHQYLLDKTCNEVSPIMEVLLNNNELRYSPENRLTGQIINSLCENKINIPSDSAFNPEDNIISGVESDDYREFVQTAIFCSLDLGLDSCKEVVNKFIETGYITALNSTTCLQNKINPICSKELMYSLKLYSEEVL